MGKSRFILITQINNIIINKNTRINFHIVTTVSRILCSVDASVNENMTVSAPSLQQGKESDSKETGN